MRISLLLLSHRLTCSGLQSSHSAISTSIQVLSPIRSRTLLLASIHGKSVGLGGSITPKIPVSSTLTADCGFVNIYNPGNLGRVMTCFHQGMNLVSLFLGKLRVASHVYSSCLAVRDRLVMLLQLAFLASGGVALRS